MLELYLFWLKICETQCLNELRWIDHVLQVQLLLFVCCVGTLVLKKALAWAGDGLHQLDGLLHHGATLSFDVAHEYYSPRSCLIACCPIVRDAITKLWMTIAVMFHGRPCLQQGAGKGWTNMVSVHLGLLQAVHWRRPPDRDHCLGRFLVS